MDSDSQAWRTQSNTTNWVCDSREGQSMLNTPRHPDRTTRVNSSRFAEADSFLTPKSTRRQSDEMQNPIQKITFMHKSQPISNNIQLINN